MNISIVGAGLLGRLLAWQLLERGCKVTLIDKDNGTGEQSAAFVAAAMLAPLSEVVDAEPVIFEKGIVGIDLWRQWAAQLKTCTAVDVDFRDNGSLVVSHRSDTGNYQQFLQRLRQQSYLDQSSIQTLDKKQLNQFEPELSPNFQQALYLSCEASLDNRAVLEALAVRIKQLGGQWQSSCLIEQINSEDFPAADIILDCRGFGLAPFDSTIRGVRGEVIRVYASEVNISRAVRLMHPRYKLYVVPRPDHHYVVGASQIESGDEGAVTVRSSLELLSALYTLHTGFSEARVLEMQARCRPATKDNLPIIKQSGKVYCINGLFRHGYLLAPSVVMQALHVLGFVSENSWPEIVQ